MKTKYYHKGKMGISVYLVNQQQLDHNGDPLKDIFTVAIKVGDDKPIYLQGKDAKDCIQMALPENIMDAINRKCHYEDCYFLTDMFEFDDFEYNYYSQTRVAIEDLD